MKINLTNKQYKTLLKLIFLGNHMVNGPRLIDERIKEFNDLEHYIYSFHKDYQLDDWIDKSSEDNQLFPSSVFEDEVMDFIDDYDSEAFIDELIHNLARRDFVKQYGDDVISKMEITERIENEHPFIEMYYNEIEKNDLKNIGIKKIKATHHITKLMCFTPWWSFGLRHIAQKAARRHISKALYAMISAGRRQPLNSCSFFGVFKLSEIELRSRILFVTVLSSVFLYHEFLGYFYKSQLSKKRGCLFAW